MRRPLYLPIYQKLPLVRVGPVHKMTMVSRYWRVVANLVRAAAFSKFTLLFIFNLQKKPSGGDSTDISMSLLVYTSFASARAAALSEAAILKYSLRVI